MNNTLGRPWDSFDAYLFDIDGTLLQCRDAVHYAAFNEALSSVAGVPLTIDGVVAHGNTDIGILRDAFAHHGIAEAAWRPHLAEMLAGMGSFAEQRRAEFRIDVLPSARHLLQYLKSRGALLGTATGNLESIGHLKLSRAGLLHFFDFTGWSDGHETRSAVLHAAAEQARARAGAATTICIIGDTTQDIRAARACGLKVIAVVTGVYSAEVLAAEHPDRLLSSFADLFPASVHSD